MWWAFPQEINSWGNINVSDTTKEFALNKEEAIRFLCQPKLYIYFKCALERVEVKKSTLRFFGKVDNIKLKSSLKIFKEAAEYLKDSELIQIINSIQKKNNF
jgi:uncharacterized protein (DUF1810 family)